jgi:hypothetical protein
VPWPRGWCPHGAESASILSRITDVTEWSLGDDYHQRVARTALVQSSFLLAATPQVPIGCLVSMAKLNAPLVAR